jgi:formylglycine-generating enzyme required for sulfatase activity
MTNYGGNGPDKPATGVSWFDAAKFVNWLNTSSGSTPAYNFDAGGNFQLWTPSDAGYDPNNLFRNTQAKYFLPSMNEWYKAAFYDPVNGLYWDYPVGTNGQLNAVSSGTAPQTAVFQQDTFVGPANVTVAGGLSPYGTMAQGGNVTEWDETAADLVNDSAIEVRGVRGGMWENPLGALSVSFRLNVNPFDTSSFRGIRVGSVVPEPSMLVLISFIIISRSWLRFGHRRVS